MCCNTQSTTFLTLLLSRSIYSVFCPTSTPCPSRPSPVQPTPSVLPCPSLSSPFHSIPFHTISYHSTPGQTRANQTRLDPTRLDPSVTFSRWLFPRRPRSCPYSLSFAMSLSPPPPPASLIHMSKGLCSPTRCKAVPSFSVLLRFRKPLFTFSLSFICCCSCSSSIQQSSHQATFPNAYVLIWIDSYLFFLLLLLLLLFFIIVGIICCWWVNPHRNGGWTWNVFDTFIRCGFL